MVLDETYESKSPAANKMLNPDGSVTTFNGAVIVGANAGGAAQYESMSPRANKFLNPDGSIATLDQITGDGSGGGGCADIDKIESRVTTLEETIGVLNQTLQAVLEGVPA